MIFRARSARRKNQIWDIIWKVGHARFAVPDTPRPPLFRPDGRKIINARTYRGFLRNFYADFYEYGRRVRPTSTRRTLRA